MADAKANKTGRFWGEMWPSITGGHHLLICPPRWFNTTTWHYVKVCACVYLCVNVCACASSMHAHCPRRDPVASLCTVLINPVMTEWIWQVVCVSGLGWKVRRGNMAAGSLPNPPKGKTQRAADPFQDRCSVWGSSPDSPMIQSRRLSPHVGPAHPETDGLMYSLM